MEYERALFRVYERSMDVLRYDQVSGLHYVSRGG